MQEPERLSILDLMQKSLFSLKRKTFLHRIIYAVKLEKNDKLKTCGVFERIKEACDGLWNASPAGLTLISPHYLITILEGSENSLLKHITVVGEAFTYKKIFIIVPHISKPLFVSWRIIELDLPESLSEVPLTEKIQEHAGYLKRCTLNLHILSEELSRSSEIDGHAAIKELPSSLKSFLPETSLIDFLMTSPITTDVEDYLKNYQKLIPYSSYHQIVWPAPSDFISKYSDAF